MGGCVSSPKDLKNEGEAPVEAPITPKNAEGETVAQVLSILFSLIFHFTTQMGLEYNMTFITHLEIILFAFVWCTSLEL